MKNLRSDWRNWVIALTFLLSTGIALGANYTRHDDVIVKGTMSVGSNTTPNSKAVLDLVSTTKGFLPPRMDTTAQDAISSPTTGLSIFNTTLTRPGYYNGSAWLSIASLTGTETFTNKTLSGNTATNLISGSGTFTFNTSGTITAPNATDTLVGKATTDTLTNKSIDGATNTITNVSLTTGVTGVLPIANGGTNNGSLSVAAGGLIYTDGTKLVNVGVGTSGQYLRSNGASAPSWTAAAGDVVGPASSTDSVVAVFDGTTGKLLKNSSTTTTHLGYLNNATANLCGISQSCTLTYKTIDADDNTIQDIDNNDIKAAAAIQLNKLNATTASRVLISDGSGFISASSVPSINIAKMTAANITYSAGTPTVTNEYGGDWISSITDGGVGLPQLNVAPATAQACTCTNKENAVSGSACMITGTSTSAINVRTRDLANTLQDESFFIVCTEWF